MNRFFHWLEQRVRHRLMQSEVDVTEAAARREAERRMLETQEAMRQLQQPEPVREVTVVEIPAQTVVEPMPSPPAAEERSPWRVPEQDSRYSPASDNDTALPGTVAPSGVTHLDRERVPPATWATPARRSVSEERLAVAGMDIAPPENEPPVPLLSPWPISLAFIGLLGVVASGHIFRAIGTAPTFSLVHQSAGDVDAGRAAFNGYGCTACHTDKPLSVRRGEVGPSLERFANRVTIAGKLANTPQNLEYFIQHPQEVLPGSAMPNLNVTDTDALNMVAYLYTLGDTP